MTTPNTPNFQGLSTRLFDELTEGFQIIDYDWKYLYVNQSVANHGKSTQEDLLGKSIMEMYPGIDGTALFKILEKCMHERTSENVINEVFHPDGSLGWCELRINPIEEGIYILSIDVTEKIRAKRELEETKRSLELKVEQCTIELERASEEINMLFAEMHHRVKNNLQIISSILNLQAAEIENTELAQVLKENKERIQSMALIHERLYLKDAPSQVDLQEYLQRLFSNKLNFNGTSNGRVYYSIDCPSICLNANCIVPLGLLINELITNCLKYNYPANDRRFINLKIERVRSTIVRVIFEDNGVGYNQISADTMDGTTKVGSTITEALIDQICGKMAVSSNGNGVEYTITFPLMN